MDKKRLEDNIRAFLMQHDHTHQDWRGPYTYQMPLISEIVERVLTDAGGTITALFPRQSGKSDALAMAAFYLLTLSAAGGTRQPVMLGVFAPKEDQALLLVRKMRNRIKRIERDLEQHGIHMLKDLESWLEFTNGTLLKAISGSKTSKIEGESFNLMVIDEAQAIDDEVYQNRISPMGAHFDAVRVFIGTPGYVPNFFYRTLQSTAPDVVHYSTDIKTAGHENPRYKRYVERQRLELGASSFAYRRQYLLEWLFNIGQPITPHDISALQQRGLESTLLYAEQPVFVGMDLAKYDDSTVGIAMAEVDERLQIISIIEMHGIGYEAQLQEILQWLSRYPFVQRVVVDATGAGDPVLEWFKAARPDLPLEPFKFSAPSKDALYKEYFRAVEDRMFGVPQSAPDAAPTMHSISEQEALKRFIDQHITLQREVKNGLLSVHHPAGGHDDHPDAAALALWAYLKRPPEATATMMHLSGKASIFGRNTSIF